MTKILSLATALAIALMSSAASAQSVDVQVGVQAGTPVAANAAVGVEADYAYAPVPPNVEGAPVAVNQGAFCYAGPHPVDTRVAAGMPWDETQGNHTHFYAPFDLRLFAFRDGCYHFVGDPRDFGYRGQVYSYYGAHPITDVHGGGWCFMIGGHGHWWRPWSPYFVVAGPWYYWSGPYDPFFHAYWPYYAVYYRSHYPRYYGGGRFHRGRRDGWAVAPPVGRVAAPARAMPATASGAGMATGGASPARAGRFASAGSSVAPAAASPSSAWWTGTQSGGAAAAPPAGSSAAVVGAPRYGSAAPSWGAQRVAPSQPSPAWGTMRTAPAQAAPSWGSSGPSRFSAPSSSAWGSSMRSAPAHSAPSFRSAPAAPSSGGARFAPSGGSSSGSFGGAIRSRGGWR